MIRREGPDRSRAQWLTGAKRLLALLDRERQLLRAGALREAAALAEEKERLAADIAVPPEPPDDEARTMVGLLQRDATRNRILLSACRDAVRAARERLEQMEAARSTLGVYDALGAKPVAAGSKRTHDRRA